MLGVISHPDIEDNHDYRALILLGDLLEHFHDIFAPDDSQRGGGLRLTIGSANSVTSIAELSGQWPG
jgi:hypothetical protein